MRVHQRAHTVIIWFTLVKYLIVFAQVCMQPRVLTLCFFDSVSRNIWYCVLSCVCIQSEGSHCLFDQFFETSDSFCLGAYAIRGLSCFFDSMYTPYLIRCAHLWFDLHTFFYSICTPSLIRSARLLWFDLHTFFDLICTPSLIYCAHLLFI
jgi:hypothetical protein